MFRYLGALLFLIFVLAVAGCGPKNESTKRANRLTAGTWAGEVQGAAITLSLSQDGRFQTVFRGGKFRAVVRGKAKLQESTLVLEASEVEGKPATSPSAGMPAKFSVAPEWTTLTSESGLTLNRKI